ncbi:subtilase-type protease inhibitor [Nocardia sp. NPDC049149]|uniref:subtilase-type protease inhibitor n=1 Tax=Nocardia sp. NPDC049149 TaxID=3364315 RepID=UPI00370FCFD6
MVIGTTGADTGKGSAMAIGLRIASAGVGLATILAVVSGSPAQAQSANGGGPSALSLTVGDDDSVNAVTNQRTVVLVCSPVVSGTHPQADQACAELAAFAGDFEKLRDVPQRFCTRMYKPVTVTAQGIWNGVPVSYRQTFPNNCMKSGKSKYVFNF